MNPLDHADIQGNILRGYRLPYAEHWFARVNDPRAARALLGELRAEIESARAWPRDKKPASTLNVAISYAGLAALELSAPILAKLPLAFREGMVRRAPFLGDDVRAFDRTWTSGRVHLWFSMHARDLPSLKERTDRLSSRVRSRVELLDYVDRAQRLPSGTEHFGFPDGISNPRVDDGSGGAAKAGDGVETRGGAYRPFAPGEFLLGHRDELGELAGDGLPVRLIENGTFVVYRKLAQDVIAFRTYLRETALRIGQSPEFIAAKLMGRWQNGLPLAASDPDAPGRLSPLAPQLQAAVSSRSAAQAAPANDVKLDLNDFDYAADRDGSGCPLGAHIRRANPRDATNLPTRSERHRLLRRGMPYGAAVPRDADGYTGERGVVFVAMNADLERQFEYVQRHWLNDGAIARQHRDRDPVCGAHQGRGKLVIQGDPKSARVPLICSELPRFVTPRGGEYFFMPSLRALSAIGHGSFSDVRATARAAGAS
jgi:Dyp-type peroxidase family